MPNWEAGLIVVFLFLPIDLLISASLHAGLMNIKFGKGIEVAESTGWSAGAGTTRYRGSRGFIGW